MKTIIIKKAELTSSAVGLGCMRIASLSESSLASYIEYCAEIGINFFDHADIY